MSPRRNPCVPAQHSRVPCPLLHWAPGSARLPRHATDLVRYQNDEWQQQDRGEEQNHDRLELGHISLRRSHRVKGRQTGGRKDCEAARSFTSLKGGRAVPPDWGRLQLRPPRRDLPAVLGRSHPSGSAGRVSPRTLPPRGRGRCLQIPVLGTNLWRGLDPGTSPLAQPAGAVLVVSTLQGHSASLSERTHCVLSPALSWAPERPR